MALGDKMFKGMAWSALERLSVQAIQFIIQIALARILTPAEYGTVGILYVFITISAVFIDSGFSKALIQKKKRTEDDISTVFFFNLGISLVTYLLLYLAAPYVADFYAIDSLTLLLQVLAISLIINALYSVPTTLYTIDLDFKSIAKINFVSSVLSGIIAYYMAWAGYGVWALVGLTLARSTIAAVMTWALLKWKPNWVFSKSSFKELFAFGSNLLISSLLNVTVNKVYELVIPKTNSIQDLGYYTQGTRFSDFVFAIVNSVLERVLLPGLSELQNQITVLVKHTRSIIKATTLVIIPFFLFLAAISEPLIRVVLGEIWLPAVPVMQIFCIARLITIVSGININLLYIIGRTDLALKQQYVKIAIRVVFLLAALKYGIVFIALAELGATIVHFFVNTHHPGKIMKYGAVQQLKDMGPIFFSASVMAGGVYGLTYFIDNDWLLLGLSGITAIAIYFAMISLFKIEEVAVIREKISNMLKR